MRFIIFFARVHFFNSIFFLYSFLFFFGSFFFCSFSFLNSALCFLLLLLAALDKELLFYHKFYWLLVFFYSFCGIRRQRSRENFILLHLICLQQSFVRFYRFNILSIPVSFSSSFVHSSSFCFPRLPSRYFNSLLAYCIHYSKPFITLLHIWKKKNYTSFFFSVLFLHFSFFH